MNFAKWKKPDPEDYIVYDSFIFHSGKYKTDHWLPGVGRGIDYKGIVWENFGSDKLFCDFVLFNKWVYAFVKTHKTAQYKGFDYRPLKKKNPRWNAHYVTHDYNCIINQLQFITDCKLYWKGWGRKELV